MMPTHLNNQAPVPPPSYHRAQTRQNLHIDALTLVSTLHLLALCRLAVRLPCPQVQEEPRARTARSLCC